VTLWATPDASHPAFAAIAERFDVALVRQCDGDLGARMLAAIMAASGPALVIGADCPALSPAHIKVAANALHSGSDAVVLPAEDGGYVLIGLRRPQPLLFSDMPWSTPQVMEETRSRLRALGLTWQEPATLWDLDLPADLQRLREIGLADLALSPT
jgi:rSAM/selenodomain-associated transferase 1